MGFSLQPRPSTIPMKRLRSLVPDSPWCAKAAAWCGLALFGVFALGLLLRLGSMARMWFSRWRMLQSPESVVPPDWAAQATGADAAAATVSISVMGLFLSIVIGAACLVVGHALSLFARLRGPLTPPPARTRRRTVVFATALGAVSLLFALLGECAMFRDIVRITRLWPTRLLAFQFLNGAHASGITFFTVLGLGVLPFCLLRMADRPVPAPATPEDATKVRRMEAWVSAGFIACVALTALDLLTTGLLGGWFFTAMSRPRISLGALALQLLPAAVPLCALHAVRSMLRRLAFGQALADKPEPPETQSAALALVIIAYFIALVVSLVFAVSAMLMYAGVIGGGGTAGLYHAGHVVMVFVWVFQLAQFTLVAVLLRLLPVRATWFPAPAPGPDSAAARRALRIVLAVVALLAARCVWKAIPRILAYHRYSSEPFDSTWMDSDLRDFGPLVSNAGIVPEIERYLRETMAPNYGGEWEHCVPLVDAVAVDIANFDDIRVYGEFRLHNYRLEGDTFHFVSGGNHPGLMHLRKLDRTPLVFNVDEEVRQMQLSCMTNGAFAVVSFDPVLDGSEYLPSAKRIFGKNFKAWQELVADDEALEAARLQRLADYAARNHLSAKFSQDPGWDPVPLPNAENALGGAGILPAETPHAEAAEIAR